MNGGLSSPPPHRDGALRQSLHPHGSTFLQEPTVYGSLSTPSQRHVPPSDIRAFADPRYLPSPDGRPHGVLGPSFATAGVGKDSISTYRLSSPGSSTVLDVKHPPSSWQTSHPSPWPVKQGHRNGNVSSGYKPTMSSPHPKDQAYHPPPPPGQSYGQPVAYGPLSPYLGRYSGQQAQVRRKQVRATQACNHCRARKQKCDEARPCQFCRENNFDCQYKDVPPSKLNKTTADLNNTLRQCHRKVKELRVAFHNHQNLVNSVLPPREDENTPMLTESVEIDYMMENAGLLSEHTAPAHRLFEDWPAMKNWWCGSQYLQKLSLKGEERPFLTYPMRLEQERGQLHVWGCGEGDHLDDKEESSESPGSSNESDTPPWAPVKRNLWEHPLANSLGRYPENHQGRLGLDGIPDFRVATMSHLLDSYKESIHSMHPFMDPKYVCTIFPEFKHRYSPDARLEKQTHEGPRVIEYSIRNAIVLLILALGKVCSYKNREPLPSPNKGAKNIDILPGMAYYSIATDILGSHLSGNTIEHAQAFILAALYMNQFTRVSESGGWTHSACRATLVLVKSGCNALQGSNILHPHSCTIRPRAFHDCYHLRSIYWASVHLESELVAEFSTLETSQVTWYQEYIGPKSFSFDGMAPNEFDSSQNNLCIIVNKAQNQLYGCKSRNYDEGNPKTVADHVKQFAKVLCRWRELLPSHLQWNDNDPPSTDRNHARLRAKYYTGLRMMLRPYLRLAVMVREWPPSHQSSHQRAPWSHQISPASMSTNTNRGVQMVDLSNDQREMINLASVCIDAAIRSTIAFDRIGAPENSPYQGYRSTRTERLVLTNIFGTMHAQFGNMLVLAAVYKSPMYKHLPENSPLTPRNLDALFARTVDAIQENAPNSPILKVDLEVLRHLRFELNLPSSS